jgi:hypothetical protein
VLALYTTTALNKPSLVKVAVGVLHVVSTRRAVLNLKVCIPHDDGLKEIGTKNTCGTE